MAEYYNSGSLLAGVAAPQMDVGDLTKAGATIAQSLKSQREREIQDSQLGREAQKFGWEQKRFDRENVLNQRQDTEYNREIGLRDMRKSLAAEYEANPYADVWGGGSANKLLDKQVLDYVNSGKEITPEIATELQNVYETNRPFKEDLAQVFRSKLLAAGEDPAKADAYAKSMTDSMPFSRATQQAQLDKQQEIQQGYYNAVAAANKDVAKMGFDIAKANQDANIDQAKLDLDYKKLMYGPSGSRDSGSSKGGNSGGGYTGITELLKDVGPFDAKDAMDKIETLHNAGYSYQQLYSALKPSIDKDATALLVSDQKFNEKALTDRLQRFTPGVDQYSNTNKINSIASNVNAKDLLAQFAPRQIAGYNPEAVLEKAKVAVPELFGGATNVIPTTNVKYEDTVKKIESSGGKYDAVNKGSGAIGAYQFLPSTLDDYRKRNGNFTNEEFVKNPELQDKVFNQFTLDNENRLSNRGIEVNDYTKWIAHNLGAGNVKDFIEGNETPKLLNAISAQFGGKSSGIKEYNDRFGKYFTGDRKADVNKGTKDLVAAFDSKTPVTTGNDVNSRYDALQSMIEPTLSPKTELTLQKKAELVDQYEPIINKVRADINENGGGPIDRKRYFDTLVADKITKNGVSKPDRDWANSVIDQLMVDTRTGSYVDLDPTRVGGIGNRKPTIKEQFELATNPKGNSNPLSAILDRYNSDDARLVDQHRQLVIANKYTTNPDSLSKEELRWIDGNKQTPNGRLLLESLGIK